MKTISRKGLVLLMALIFPFISGFYAVNAQFSTSDIDTRVDADVSATGGSGFRISPTRYEIVVEPGDTETRSIEIKNVTTTTRTAVAVINDFQPSDDESGQPQIVADDTADPNAYSIKPFVLPVQSVTLDPEESKDVKVTFSVPEGTAPGAYYGVVRFVEDNVGDPEAGNIALTASVGTIFLVTVPGTTVEKLSLVDITAGSINDSGSFTPGFLGGKFFSSAPSAIAIRLQNEGNTFIAPFGTINITDWNGNLVYSYEINQTVPRGNVLPDSVRRFQNEVESIGSIGRYTVTAAVAYGEGGGNIITAEMTFWVLPWIPILVGLGLVIFIVFGGTRGLKMYNRMVINREKGQRVKRS